MKNFISKKMFNTVYNDLPLASEIIVDLKLSRMKYQVLSCFLFTALIITVILICNTV